MFFRTAFFENIKTESNSLDSWSTISEFISGNKNEKIVFLFLFFVLKKTPTLWLLFMDGVQLLQGLSHFAEAVYFLTLSPQKFLVLTLSTTEGWKAESTLEPPSGFEHGTPGLRIQLLSH